MANNQATAQAPKTALQEIVERNKSDAFNKSFQDAVKSAYPEHLVRAIQAVLATDAGKTMLNEMTNHYMRNPFCLPGSPEGHGYWRDGQASVMRDMWMMMKIEL